MDNINYAFQYSDEEDSKDYNRKPSFYIKAMFDNTDADGKVYIPIWPTTDPDESIYEKDGYLEIEMNWKTKKDFKTAEDAFKALMASLQRIAAVYDKLGKTIKKNATILSEEDLAVWKTYLRPIKTEFGYPEEFYDAAEKRLGRRLASADVMERAWRTCRLISLGAPAVIVNHEAGILAQTLVVNMFGKSVTYVEYNAYC